MENDSLIQSSEESLEIIGQIINQAKQKDSSDSFFNRLWGWVVVVANLGNISAVEGAAAPMAASGA